MHAMDTWLTDFLAPALRPSADDRHIELLDGRRVAVQPVAPQDAVAERAFVDGLSLTSRYRRFHFGLRELSPEASRAMTELDPAHEFAFVARPSDDDKTIVADARYVCQADTADAEFAIAVADAWQGAGLGRALLLRLATHARSRGVQRLFGDVLWGNAAMLAVVRSLGGRWHRTGDATVVRVEIDLSEMAADEVFFAPVASPSRS